MSDATRDSESVQSEVRIDASPEVVFPYFTDPAKMLLWKGLASHWTRVRAACTAWT